MNLPTTEVFMRTMESLKSIGLCEGYPCICQESSLLLYIWLKKQNIKCKIMFGDYKDPVIDYNSPHFWVETDSKIVDGSAIQFELPNYNREYSSDELFRITNIVNCSMVYELNNTNYTNKVLAYISNRMKFFIKDLMKNKDDSFEDYINCVRRNIYLEIKEDFKYSMFSSLCKNNMEYYKLTREQFIEKCIQQGMIENTKYITLY